MTKLKPEFLTMRELGARWGVSDAYLHELVRTAQIVPAMAPTDTMRMDLAGAFRGGAFVGDIYSAEHDDYAERYASNTLGDEDHWENWPECESSVVYCHCPVDDEGGYSFNFFSESPDPNNTARWFYFGSKTRVGDVDGDRRFRFLWCEIERFEAMQSAGENKDGPEEDCETPQEDATAPVVESPQVTGTLNPPEASNRTQHRIARRSHALSPEIETAVENSSEPEDVHLVWVELCKLAEKGVGCLIGIDEDQIKYRSSEGVGFFSKKNLRDRLRRREAR